ncbi:hypothetical protein J6590_103722 [Homalodisca vitripennis]|nr:hypothetical protein J6590_103722 [Homalodisca vitripennis]
MIYHVNDNQCSDREVPCHCSPWKNEANCCNPLWCRASKFHRDRQCKNTRPQQIAILFQCQCIYDDGRVRGYRKITNTRTVTMIPCTDY